MVIIITVYLLGFILFIVSGIVANKVDYANKKERHFLGIGQSMMFQKHKWRYQLFLILHVFSRALVWFIGSFLGLFYAIRDKVKKKEFSKVRVAVYDVLYVHSEILTVILMFGVVLSFCLVLKNLIPLS